jgi:excisionase family DNA binding protein
MSTVLDGKFLTVSEVADILGLSGARVRQLIASGQLEAEPAHERLWLISRESVLEFKKLRRPTGVHVDKRQP